MTTETVAAEVKRLRNAIRRWCETDIEGDTVPVSDIDVIDETTPYYAWEGRMTEAALLLHQINQEPYNERT